MVSKHIPRDYSAHRKSVIRPYDEFVGLEIFSYDPQFTSYFLAENNQFKIENVSKASWKAWTCYRSTDKENDMVLSFDYNVTDEGLYRIDFLYEQNSKLYSSKDLTGELTVSNSSRTVYNEKYLKWDGEDNVLKRIPLYLEFKKDKHHFEFEVPPNCYFMGVVVRKVIKYTANNYYGADNGKDAGNMMLTDATLTISDMMKPSELQCTIGYDDAFECEASPSGFYINYRDEVNFYVKDDDGVIEQVFGGYVSSILPNANRTELEIHCADRLVDGENKYILDEMKLNGGTTDSKEDEYSSSMTKYFSNYAHALKYLCDINEVTLKSNISSNYLVDGEKDNKGFTISYGKNKDIDKIPVNNCQSKSEKNFITIRNNPSGDKKQIWTLYTASKHSKKPILLDDKGYMHITYGLGKPSTSRQVKNTKTVDVTDEKAGVQSFGKCGQSKDGKYLMAIGQYSGAKGTKGYNYHTIYKTIFENKCPHCGGKLVWDSGRSDTNCVYCGNYKGSKRTWGNISETEITCKSCCADYDSVTGYEKDAPWKRLKKVSKTVKSSKAEQNKLHKGQMKAIPKTGVEISPDDILSSVAKIAKKYKYKRGTSSTYAQMKKSGSGDCFAFSDCIFTELKKYGVLCKIVSYPTTEAPNGHHSVLYKDADNKWQDFPYKKYGLSRMLYATSKSKNGKVVQNNKVGSNIGNIKVSSKTTTKKETTTTTVTQGYDKSKPIQGYLKLTYSNTASFKASKKTLYLKFTLATSEGEGIMDKGFVLYWVNNATMKATLMDRSGKPLNLVEYIRQIHRNPNENVYLQSIQMIAPVKTAKSENDSTDYYTNNKSTKDNSSCKMDLYQITFNNDKSGYSDEWKSCGKTVLSMMKDLVDESGYYVDMTYGKHRNEDRIHFRVNNTSDVSYTAREGDNNNILSWNSISYSPISSLFNNSIQVFKKEDGDYHYVHSRYPKSVLEYGELSTLETSSNIIDDREAYYYARMNPKFNGEQTYTYTVTVPNYPNLRLGELVNVVANAKKLSTTKEVKSIKIIFKKSSMPRIQTEIGLDELAPDIQLRENIRNLRRDAKKNTTSFDGGASPINDDENNHIYIWDK